MTTFRSTLVVHDKLVVRIPEEIGDICDEIQNRYRNDEFSILCKADWGPKGFTLSRTEWTIPIQKISGGSVDYDAENLLELKQQGYNTVIHSHPFQMKVFSGRDKDTICTHFPCSVLYCQGDFTDATLAVMISPGHTFQSKAEVDCIHYSNVELPEDGLKNITKFHNPPTSAVKKEPYDWKWKGKYDVVGKYDPKKNSVYRNQYEETQQQLLLEERLGRGLVHSTPDILDIAIPTDEVLGRLRTDVVDFMTNNAQGMEADLLDDGAYFRRIEYPDGGICDGVGMFVRGRYVPMPSGKGGRSGADKANKPGKHGKQDKRGGKSGGLKSSGSCLIKLEPEEAKMLTEKFIERHHANVAALKQGAVP